MAKRRNKRQKARRLTEEQRIIDMDARREERRRQLREEAEALRAKRGRKSMTQEMFDEIYAGEEEPAEGRSAHRRRRRNKKSLSSHTKIYIAVIAVLLILLAASVGQIIELKIEENRAQKDLEALTTEKEELEEQVSQLNSPEYMEKQAREWLKMTEKGELIYTFGDEDDSSSGDSGNGDTAAQDGQ